MALLTLNLGTPELSPRDGAPSCAPSPSHNSAVAALSYGSVSLGLFPGRGLLYSFLFHEIALFALLLFWPTIRMPIAIDPPKTWELTMIPKDTLYLPALGGGDSGGQRHGTSLAKAETNPSLAVATWSKAGVSYPGKQAIISSPPHPTNHIQTILQPALANPPELSMFVPLPNIVRLPQANLTPTPVVAAEAAKADPSGETQAPHDASSTATIPLLRIAAPPVIEAPKLALPMVTPAADPALQATAVPPAVAPPPKPTPAQVRALPGSSGADAKTLVALSVMPAPPQAVPKLPAGEAHGQFAIVALPNLAMSNLGPGSVAETATPTPVGSGANSIPSAHDAAGTRAFGVGGSPAPAPSRGGAVAAGGPGAAVSGAGHNASGEAGGGMTIRGAASGSGPGAGSASGAGAGSGPAPGAFAGMTIQGGDWPDGIPAGVVARSPEAAPEPGTYGLTVVSTASSGGGLGDYGVFYDEKVFTVYISMKTSSDPAAPSWTMEYAALHASESGGGKVAPPFPTRKEVPAWPGDLVARYQNQLVVAYVVIDESGKVERAKSMDSPNVQFTAPLLAALSDWEFRPGTVNGKPIAVRALFGVPIYAAPPPSSAAAQ